MTHGSRRPTSDEILATLDRIVKSPSLAEAPRLATLLTFVVESALSDPHATLVTYDLAVEALGLDRHFDPSSDPRVHVEVARLRRALARYYGETAPDERVLIELPPGSYVPVFRRRAPFRMLANN